jgi:flagellar basal body L-ring protein FlgH
MKLISHLLCFACWASPAWLVADSLLDQPVISTPASSPSSPFKLQPRQRPIYDFRLHDTIMVNVNIDDTIQFSKKQDTKRDSSWAMSFKALIDNFGGAKKSSLPAIDFGSSGENKTKGDKKDGSKIRLDVPCEVIEILPSGDLVIDGIRLVKADENNVTVKVGGRVNPKYIDPLTDAVQSEKILMLEVKTDFEGPLADNEKRGFVSKFLDRFKVF